MTKTIFGKKLLMLATITVLVTGLTLAATFDDAEAKKGPPSGAGHDLKCKDNIGSFMATPGGQFVSTGESKCKFIGHAAFTTVTEFSGLGTGPNCITLMGAGLGAYDGYGISKKGFFTFTVGTLEQCFFDSGGVALTGIPGTTDFCGSGLMATTSTVTGPFGIIGGLIKGGTVVGGSGTITTAVDHCAMGAAPGGDSAVTTMTGTIDFL